MTGGPTCSRRSWRSRLLLGVAAAIALLALGVLVFRTRRPAVLRVVRQVNKKLLNPLMLRAAGREHWYAAQLEHVGRRSGRPYRTPVVALPVSGGFAVPLAYGTNVDWLRNILAAHGAVLHVKGVRYDVAEPRVVATAELSAELSALCRTLGIDRMLRVSAATPADGVPEQRPAPAPAAAR